MVPPPRTPSETGERTRLIFKLHHLSHLILIVLACVGHLAVASPVQAEALASGETTDWPVDLTLPLRALWEIEPGQAPLSSWRAPLREGILILPATGAVEARDARSGELVWRHRLDGLSPRCAVFLHDLVVVGGVSVTGATDLRALDQETGNIRFEARIGGVFVGPIAAGPNLIVASSHALAALDAEGVVLWQVDFPRQPDGFPGGPTFSRPALLGEQVVVGAGDAMVHAFALDDGRELWSVPLTRQIHSGAASDGKQVVLATDQLILALDGAGHERWRHQVAGDPVFASPRIAEGLVFVATGTGKAVVALEAESGRLIWQTAVGANVFSRPVLTRRQLVVGDMANRITILDRMSGFILGRWSLASGTGIYLSDPVIEQGLVGVGTADGVFQVLESSAAPPAMGSGALRVAPNPFSEEITLVIDPAVDQGAEESAGELSVYDSSGRLRSLILLPAGSPWRWDGRDALGRRLAAGIYFLRLETVEAVRTAKVELLP
jgi:outer membrane protein assembly factor BamB